MEGQTEIEGERMKSKRRYTQPPVGWKLRNPLYMRLQAEVQRLGDPAITRQLPGLECATRARLTAAITTVQGLLSGELQVNNTGDIIL